ncbi:alpha/beta hydrolase fold domain-containing protein [Pedobacter sp. Leaf194]|uniref:alpha/beta hydrolase fold domain-containing protein n=1 Tax=Pedobacter sp. Leaf194 TaxID=1736297 RepID=UPI0007032427|nr:alpha/beta hydrolase fold domain-containing protein [Pedobacter sp. Leaf194]KQS36222.1 hypothetical protein ASG14_12400 [Pedobacter sp. Leaf194]
MKTQKTRKMEAVSLFEDDNLTSQGFFMTQLVKWIYIPDIEMGQNISAPLLRARNDQLKGLPPILVQIGKPDVLGDEVEGFGRKLDPDRIKVIFAMYKIVNHDFELLNPLAKIYQTISFSIHQTVKFRKYLM